VQDNSGAAPGRGKWRYAEMAKQFHASHNYTPFTMVDNEDLERLARDPRFDKHTRIYTGVYRLSRGNLCEIAVDAMPQLDASDPQPQPYTQARFAAWVEVSESEVSRGVTDLKQWGYLRSDTPQLSIEDRPPLFAGVRGPSLNHPKNLTSDFDARNSSSPFVRSSSPFVRFRETYLAENTELSERQAAVAAQRDLHYAAARACSQELRAIERRILSAFHKEERAAARNGASGCNGAQPEPVASEPDAAVTSDFDGAPENATSDFDGSATSVSASGLAEADVEIDGTPNSSAVSDGPSRAFLNVLNTSLVEGVSVGSFKDDRPTDRPTEAETPTQKTPDPEQPEMEAIEAAIPPWLMRDLSDAPTPTLKRRIREALGRALPLDQLLQGFTQRILIRRHKITSLGLLVGLAADAARSYALVAAAGAASPRAPNAEVVDAIEAQWQATVRETRERWSDLPESERAFYRAKFPRDYGDLP
jgi:hypothetical protein